MSDDRRATPLRYHQVSAEATALLKAEGESGRFEFKQTARSVKPEVLCAAANWVALDPSREHVTLLVGVEEKEDPATGLVTGSVIAGGLNLQKAVETIQNLVRETRPVPVNVTIIEEGVATSAPFVRLEIRPTFAPHYDAEGRRQTRNNASTRPLTDEELLDLYLDREAAKFEQRFQRTAQRLTNQLATIGDDVDYLRGDLSTLDSNVEQVSDGLMRLQDSSWTAADEAEESRSVAERIESDLEELGRDLLGQRDDSPPGLYFRVMDMRWTVWDAFACDAAYRPTRATDKLTARLKTILENPISPHDWLANMNEISFWADALRRRDRKWTMTAWSREITKYEDRPEDTGLIALDDNLIATYAARRAEDQAAARARRNRKSAKKKKN